MATSDTLDVFFFTESFLCIFGEGIRLGGNILTINPIQTRK